MSFNSVYHQHEMGFYICILLVLFFVLSMICCGESFSSDDVKYPVFLLVSSCHYLSLFGYLLCLLVLLSLTGAYYPSLGLGTYEVRCFSIPGETRSLLGMV